jgi:serine/threonine protein kinase
MWDYMASPIGSSDGHEIGRGGSSQVILARDPVTGKAIAVKCFSGSNSRRTDFIREVESLAQLNHPCVLRIVRWSWPDGSRYGEIHTEFAEGGSLEAVLTRFAKRPRTCRYMTDFGILICDIVLGMRFIHLRHIIHRDMKPSNILISGNGRALIGDFGSSRADSDYATSTGESGTVYYAAPELFDEGADWTPKVDVWSFGLILYEMMTGAPVFPISLPPFDVIRKMRRQDRPMIPDECGDYMEDLIRRCWSDDPSSRPSFDEILQEFRDLRFAILPAVDCRQLRDAVDGVLRWECDADVPQSRK